MKKNYRIGEKIRISYHPKKQTAEIITASVIAEVQGKDLIVVDREGNLYTTWWETDTVRPKKPKTHFQRHWRKYQSGFFSLKRSLTYALLQAEQIRIPTLAELQEFCAIRNAKIAVFEDDIENRLDKLADEFEAAKFFLQGKYRWTLKESEIQLSFFLLLRDSQGRLNLGVLRARLAAIDFRFKEELKHMLGWMPHYASRIEAMTVLQADIYGRILFIARRLNGLIGDPGYIEDEIKELKAELERIAQLIKFFSGIKPFDKWAEYCLEDLRSAYRAIGQKAFTEIIARLKRVLCAMQIRLIGFDLEELVSEVGINALFCKKLSDSSRQRIAKLIGRLSEIDDANFREPVCQSIIKHLKKASLATRTLTAKKHLKSAAELI